MISAFLQSKLFIYSIPAESRVNWIHSQTNAINNYLKHEILRFFPSPPGCCIVAGLRISSGPASALTL